MADKQSKEYRLLTVILALQIVLVVLVGYLVVTKNTHEVIRETVAYPGVYSQQTAEPVGILVDKQLKWGSVNTTDWTVPVDVEVTLSQANSETAAFVQFDGQQVALEREGMQFSGMLNLPLFSEPGGLQLVVEEGDDQQLEILERYQGWQDHLLSAGLLTFETAGGRLEYNSVRERVECRGRLSASAECSTSTWPVSAVVIMDMDGQEMARQELAWEKPKDELLNQRMDMTVYSEKISWEADSTPDKAARVTIRGQIVDSHGLIYEYAPQTVFEHHLQMEQTAGSTAWTDEPMRIIAPDGQVLFAK